MSLPRKDIRAKLDAHWHDLMCAVADADELDDGAWIERLIVRELQQRIHAATVIAAAAQRAGIAGIVREQQGIAGHVGP